VASHIRGVAAQRVAVGGPFPVAPLLVEVLFLHRSPSKRIESADRHVACCPSLDLWRYTERELSTLC
jgi:hypothetical protein